MQQMYMFCDTQGVCDDVIVSDARKAQRIVALTQGRVGHAQCVFVKQCCRRRIV